MSLATDTTEGWIAEKSPRRTDGGPAFPQKHLKWTDQFSGKECVAIGFEGMSRRDWFAGQALAGMLANSEGNRELQEESWAEMAFAQADAMLEVSNRDFRRDMGNERDTQKSKASEYKVGDVITYSLIGEPSPQQGVVAGHMGENVKLGNGQVIHVAWIIKEGAK